MKKIVFGAVIVVGALAAVAYYRGMFSGTTQTADQGANTEGRGGRRGGGTGGGGGFPGGGGFGGFGGRGQGARGPMTVELAQAARKSIAQEVTVVGNLIGEATVSVAPRTAGRLQEMHVRLGDRVTRGQRIAKIEDYEIVEQVKQAEAAQEVSLATIRQREADLRLAQTNAERSRNLFERQLLPKQTLDDNEARFQSAIAQLDLARAQMAQSKARLDELRINLANTIITSPVNGFVAKRSVDPGAFVSQNAPVADVVDITTVRLVANIVEKDLKQLQSGNATRVEVDAFPGETFRGRIARVSPVLDPATRTAPIEIEIPNPDFRLKPGMYARVGITTDIKKDALVVPVNAVVDLGGRRGVFQPQNDNAVFRSIQVGTELTDFVEVLGGIAEGDSVITTGAAALRDGDRVLIQGRAGGRGRRGDANGSQAQGAGGAAPGRGGSGQGIAGREGRSGQQPPGAGGASRGTDGREGRRFGGDGQKPAGEGRRYGGDGRRFGGTGGRRGDTERPSAPPSSQ
jgi:HlyD family secretion protein